MGKQCGISTFPPPSPREGGTDFACQNGPKSSNFLWAGLERESPTGPGGSEYDVFCGKRVTPAASSALTPLDMGLVTVVSEAEETKDGEHKAELVALARQLFAFAVAQPRRSSLPRAAGHAGIGKASANNRAADADRGRHYLVQAFGL